VLMRSKITTLILALVSAGLSILFASLHQYVCLVAALLLMLIFDGIWAAKVSRDKRLAAMNSQSAPSAPAVPRTSTGSLHLTLPK